MDFTDSIVIYIQMTTLVYVSDLLQQWDLTILIQASLRYVMCVYKISVFIIVISLYQF